MPMTKRLPLLLLGIVFLGGIVSSSFMAPAISLLGGSRADATTLEQDCNMGNNITRLAVSPDGKLLLATWNLSEARLWDLMTGKLLQRFQDDPQSVLTDVALSPNGKYSATGSNTGAVIWDVETGEKLYKLDRGFLGDKLIVRFSPDSQYLFTGAHDGVGVWSVQKGQLLHSFPGAMETDTG